MDPKPQIRCLLAKQLTEGVYLVKRGDPFTLEEALDFTSLGWECIPDPFDQEALTRWEMLNRTKPKWAQW